MTDADLPRPTFIRTRGQRARAGPEDHAGALHRHYERILSGVYDWEISGDGSERVPEGWVEHLLYRWGGAGVADVHGMPVLAGATPTRIDVYGQPLEWLPAVADAAELPDGLMSEQDSPVLWQGVPVHDEVEALVQTQTQALGALRSTIAAMQQPVVISGIQPGAELQGVVLKSALDDGWERWISSISQVGSSMQVLDLHAQDWTGPLLSVMRAADAMVLRLIGLYSWGTDKESGVSDAETQALSQPLDSIVAQGLERRQAWAQLVTEWCGDHGMGWQISCGLRGGAEGPQSEGRGPGDGDGTDEDEDVDGDHGRDGRGRERVGSGSRDHHGDTGVVR